MTLTKANNRMIDGAVSSVIDFGAIGDGVTDDTSAVQLALAAGGVIYFPAGTYKITSFSITPLANSRLIGDGQGISTIKFVSTTTTSKIDFDTTNGNISFENLSIYHDGIASETCQIIAFFNDNINVKNCEIYSNDASGVDTATNAFYFLNADCDNIKVKDCNIHHVNRVILKANASIANVTNVTFDSNHIHDLGEGGVQFNFPSGSISGVKIINNYFDRFYSGTEKIFCGGASLKNAVIANNVFTGNANECIHLEEAGENISITGNNFEANADGIFITDNNVSGTYEKPEQIVISGNTFFDASLTRANTGIKGVNDGTGVDEFDALVISNNTFRGYDYAIALSFAAKNITGNIIKNCDFGMRIDHATPGITNNIFEGCATALFSVSSSGLFGVNSFRDCTVIGDASSNEKISMKGFRVFVSADTNLPASTTTNVNLDIDIGSEFWGFATANVYIGATLYRHRISQLEYNGSTLTDTEKQQNGSGVVAFSGFVNNSGELAIALNNTGGTALTLKRISVEFDGMWTSSS